MGLDLSGADDTEEEGMDSNRGTKLLEAVGMRESTLTSTLLSDQGGRDGLVGREAATTDLPLVCHSAVALLWHSGFLPQAFIMDMS